MSAPLDIIAGLLLLFPPLGLLLSWPRKRMGAWFAGALCAGLWIFGAYWGGAEQFPWWRWTAPAAALACLYSIYVCSRNAGEYDRLDLLLAKRKEAKGLLDERLAAAKARGKDVETEQREVLALYGMVKGLSEALTWDDIRPTLENAVEQYLRVSEFSIYVVDAANQERLRALVRRKLGSSVGSSWETIQRALQERNLPANVPHFLENPERAVALPIFESQKLVGYFYARLPKGLEPRPLLAKAQTFVDEISFAFRRIILFQEMEQLSQIDGLTGVYRRGALDERLKEELLRCQTFKTTFCMMLLDIDHFKSLNDKYGHQFGDHVLSRVGEVLKAGVYETDFVARYGGEEFAILLPRADPAGVLRKAEALRQAIESEKFNLAMQQVRVTVSIGVAHYPRDGASVEAVVRQADQALYRAKETGRNRVIDASVARNSQGA